MGMIFDTSIWVGLASSQISGQAVHQAAGDESVYISAISLGELNFGVESCSDPGNGCCGCVFCATMNSGPFSM